MEASEAAWAGVGWGWSMAVFTYQLAVREEVLLGWAGLLSLGLYFRWVMLRSISHFSRTVGPHWTSHCNCLAKGVLDFLWGRECLVLILHMPGTAWTESLYAQSSLYTCTAGVPALRASWALSNLVWGGGAPDWAG
jgi:hypothetical protein